jgi:deoxycytidylate deaminase
MLSKNLKKVIEISYAFIDKRNAKQRCRHFSFIFYRNKLLSIGSNNCKTHPLNLKFNYVNRQMHKISSFVGTHSEMKAVIKLGTKDCSGLTLINTRINRKNEIDYSMPCKGCLDMIQKLNFKEVYFTTKKGDFDFLKIEPKSKIIY